MSIITLLLDLYQQAEGKGLFTLFALSFITVICPQQHRDTFVTEILQNWWYRCISTREWPSIKARVHPLLSWNEKQTKNKLHVLFFQKHIRVKLSCINSRWHTILQRSLLIYVSGFKLISSAACTLKTASSSFFFKDIEEIREWWKQEGKKLSDLSQIHTLTCSTSLTLVGFAGSMFSSAVLLSISATWLMNREGEGLLKVRLFI